VARQIVDHKLVLKAIPVTFLDGTTSEGCAEGNNAAWKCGCDVLLVGRCYFQFGDTCYTECELCSRRYRVQPDDRKRAVGVVQEA
jgi:hypothetical protein